jgi:glycosyltransferase involved in cell wall biosynthesis
VGPTGQPSSLLVREGAEKTLKILHTVEFYAPHIGGSEWIVRQISEGLAARGHDVTVATSSHRSRSWNSLGGVNVQSFRISGKAALGISGDADAYRQFLRQAEVDVMLNYGSQVWPTDLALDLLDELPYQKVLLPLGFSMLGVPQFADYYSSMPEFLRRYDAVVCNSENFRDWHLCRSAGVERMLAIPNGAAIEEFDDESPKPSFRNRFAIRTPFMILNVSNHYNYKGHRRMIHAFRELEREDVTFVMVGEKVGRPWSGCYFWCRKEGLRDGGLKILDGVERELVVAGFKDADVFVLGSEIECDPTVIYEAMAAGLPFVSTDCGSVRDREEYGVVVDRPESLGKAINALLDDPERRNQLGEKGREAWRSSFTWDSIVDRYEDLFEDLIRGT